MVAACGRYLHQPINDVMDWDADLFFLMFMALIMFIIQSPLDIL